MENKKDTNLKERKAKIRKKIEYIIKNKEKVLLYTLLAFVIILKLYYFSVTINQAVWWDEGDYLAVAKELTLDREDPEWWTHFTGMRPMLVPLIWAFLFLLNFGEPIIRFLTLLIPSILTII